MEKNKMTKNPHFDDNRILWKDSYAGEYEPVKYGVQFDDQWRLFLEKKTGFHNHSGVETSDDFINHRIYELTGVDNFLDLGSQTRYNIASNVIKSQTLNESFPLDFFKDKKCIDIGCGAGRWTKTLQKLGCKVTSTDVSPHGLESVRKFNDDVHELNLFDIVEKRDDFHNKFDLAICWGVIMCTHNPKLAFENVCQTVAPGGYLYIMVYNDTYHHSHFVVNARKHYHTLHTFEEKLNYAYAISKTKENAINQLDMLNTFYNWTIDEDTARSWYREAGFTNVKRINKGGCAHHIIGQKPQ